MHASEFGPKICPLSHYLHRVVHSHERKIIIIQIKTKIPMMMGQNGLMWKLRGRRFVYVRVREREWERESVCVCEGETLAALFYLTNVRISCNQDISLGMATLVTNQNIQLSFPKWEECLRRGQSLLVHGLGSQQDIMRQFALYLHRPGHAVIFGLIFQLDFSATSLLQQVKEAFGTSTDVSKLEDPQDDAAAATTRRRGKGGGSKPVTKSPINSASAPNKSLSLSHTLLTLQNQMIEIFSPNLRRCHMFISSLILVVSNLFHRGTHDSTSSSPK